MSLKDFKIRIQEGDKLVILDEYVLDVSKFKLNHPGGRFAIEHNVGRDISKFFYGTQSLEDNTNAGGKGITHTNYARLIVNQIIIAKLDNEQEGGVQTMQCLIHEGKNNGTNQSLALSTESQAPVPAFKKYYPGLSIMGQHFKV